MYRYVLTVCLLISATVAGDERPVRVVVEHWPPWEVAYDEKQQRVTGGYAVEIVQELFQRMDLEHELQNAPWRRALQQMKMGQSDLIPMISASDERREYMLFTVPVYVDQMLIAYSSERFADFQWQQWLDLEGYKIRTVRGYFYGNDWLEAVKRYQLDVGESVLDQQNVRMLDEGRTDLTLLIYSSGVSLLKDYGYGKIRFADKPVYSTTLRFGIAKQSPLAARLDEVNKVLNAMKADGTFAEILGPLYVE